MSGNNVILRVDLSNSVFQKTFRKLAPNIKKEAQKALSELFLLDITQAPAKLHLHTLTDKSVPSVQDPTKKIKVYTIHITSNDTHKASFTLEDGTAHMRVCGSHDDIDKCP